MKSKSFTQFDGHQGSILGYYTEAVSFKINYEVLKILESLISTQNVSVTLRQRRSKILN